ncbi:protealysin inhibitor emfourin [Roseibium album]|uniref:protealysin inhibitor emfourin n=1 Tax=Roseibium album TaxID=311410 RepID=UPI003D6638CB
MRVKLRRSPNVLGVVFGVDLDFDELHTDEAEHLLQLVEHARPAFHQQSKAVAGYPDVRTITIVVETPDRKSTVKFREDNPPDSTQPLLEFLSKREEVIPSE